MAERIIDFIFTKTPPGKKIEIGYFGGEPLLEFAKIKTINGLIKNHKEASNHPIEFQIVTNGTIFSDEIAVFLNEMNISLVISCDGPPHVQNINRKYSNGLPSATKVEHTIHEAVSSINVLMVNAVYTPQTYRYLPETVDYFYNRGIRNIFLNPDFSARWTEKDAMSIHKVFLELGERYFRWYCQEDPAIISFIDSKISLILNEGCNKSDMCSMGIREFAFTPDGKIFPCERLVFDGEKNEHCIGTIETGIDYQKFRMSSFFLKKVNPECLECSLRAYCMNWCGCSNFFSTGFYNRVGPFICAYEKAAIKVAFNVFQELSDKFGASMITRLFKKQYQDCRI